MTSKVLGLVALLGLCACPTKLNPAYCDENADCKNGFQCDLASHGCVALDDGGVDASGTCELDDECSSGVCNAGACEDPANVLYVAPDGLSAGECTESARCELSYALNQVNASRHTIRLATGSYSSTDIVWESPKPLIIVGGRNAVLSRQTTGAVLELRQGATGTPDVTLRGITVQGGILSTLNGTLTVDRVLFSTGSGEARPSLTAMTSTIEIYRSEFRDGVTNAIELTSSKLTLVDSLFDGLKGTPLRAEYGGPIIIEHSTFSNNTGIGVVVFDVAELSITRSTFLLNLQGGIDVRGNSARFSITNNFVTRNGNEGHYVSMGIPASPFGGMRLDTSNSLNLVEHNTITYNWADYSASVVLAGGLYCATGTARNNIIAQNFRGNAELPNAQIGGSCDFSTSMVQQSADPVGLVDIVHNDLHLGSASPAINSGTHGSVTVDIDGDPRSDGLPDLGADEFR